MPTVFVAHSANSEKVKFHEFGGPTRPLDYNHDGNNDRCQMPGSIRGCGFGGGEDHFIFSCLSGDGELVNTKGLGENESFSDTYGLNGVDYDWIDPVILHKVK